ncbi:MAG: hypothetical protein KKB51_18940 [Candidatus Riflebacteria bacterium]|nr:hypothetical protein [Candidatus Riflebacteria bacterium]
MIAVPTISELIHHIKRCPPEFLAPPVINGKGEVHTEALANDVIRMLSADLTAAKALTLTPDKRSPAELILIQICCWILTHTFFKEIDNRWLNDFLRTQLSAIAPLIKSELWIQDEERAEELARMILKCSGYIPAGETRDESLDRFDSVNTIKRLKVIEESKAAIERAKELRQKMAEKKAREAANVYSRE